jgi:hypothetical protein
VVLGGYGSHQIAKAKDPVGVAANSTALLLVAAFAGYTKGVNQLRRDQELGIRNKNGFQIIHKDNFVPAKKRYEDLNRQYTAVMFAPGVVIATALATAAFAPVAAALGCSVVLGGIGLAVRSRKDNLAYHMEYAARDIEQQHTHYPCSNLANVVGAARSFLGRQL